MVAKTKNSQFLYSISVFLRLRFVKINQFLQNKNLGFEKYDVVGGFLKKLVGLYFHVVGRNEILEGLQLVGNGGSAANEGGATAAVLRFVEPRPV